MNKIGILLIIFLLSLISLFSCKPSYKKIPVFKKTPSVIVENQNSKVTYINNYLNDNNNYVYVFNVVSSKDDLLKTIIDIQEFSINKDNKSIYLFGKSFENKSIIGNNFILYLNNEKIDNLDEFNNKEITKDITNLLEIEILINHLFKDNTLTTSILDECTQLMYINCYDRQIQIKVE